MSSPDFDPPLLAPERDENMRESLDLGISGSEGGAEVAADSDGSVEEESEAVRSVPPPPPLRYMESYCAFICR